MCKTNRISDDLFLFGLILAAFTVYGCAEHPIKPATLAAAAPAPVTPPAACVPVRSYSDADKAALAAAVSALPAGNPIIGAMAEYTTLRKAARAGCSAK